MFDCLAMENEQVWRKQLPVTVTFDEKTFLFLFPLHTLILLIKILLALNMLNTCLFWKILQWGFDDFSMYSLHISLIFQKVKELNLTPCFMLFGIFSFFCRRRILIILQNKRPIQGLRKWPRRIIPLIVIKRLHKFHVSIIQALNFDSIVD